MREEAESAILTESGSVISELSGGDDCSVIGESTSDATVRRNTLLPWLKTCEPCPPTVGYLHRFLNYCYIIQRPFYQWIRFVSCPTFCSLPCWCSNTRCVKTNYKLVWVWAYCTQDTGYGFKYGLNFRWLWLPQDCQCKEFYQIG